jgi:hypothetical protein
MERKKKEFLDATTRCAYHFAWNEDPSFKVAKELSIN